LTTIGSVGIGARQEREHKKKLVKGVYNFDARRGDTKDCTFL
jgi:hypothetical protein